MVVVKKSVMKDGTKIQMEDWSTDYPSVHAKNDMIVAYPICKDDTGLYFIKRDEEFRLQLQFSNEEQSNEAYDNLVNGTKVLKDYLDNIEPKFKNAF